MNAPKGKSSPLAVGVGGNRAEIFLRTNEKIESLPLPRRWMENWLTVSEPYLKIKKLKN